MLSAILRGQWAIDPAEAQKLLPLVVSMLKGNNIANTPAVRGSYADDDKDKYEVQNRLQFAVVGDAGVTKTKAWDMQQAPLGSVAIIAVDGVITRADNCGTPGSESIAEWIKQANANGAISGTLLKINSPGGSVDGLNLVRDAIKAHDKPIVAYIDGGICASAAYHMASGADAIYAQSKTDMVGSVGTMTTYADFTGFFEKEGIFVKDLYAKQSADKNGPWRAAQNEPRDFSGIESLLSFYAQDFIDTVKAGRGNNLTSDAWQTGAIYFAEEAQKMGLIDGIQPIEQVLMEMTQQTQLYV